MRGSGLETLDGQFFLRRDVVVLACFRAKWIPVRVKEKRRFKTKDQSRSVQSEPIRL